MRFKTLLALLILTGCGRGYKSTQELESPILDTLDNFRYNCTIERDTIEIGVFLIEITHTYFNIGISKDKEDE